MKNSNSLTMALTLGAAVLIAGGANAQTRANTNGNVNNGTVMNGSATNTNLGSAGFGTSYYGNGSGYYGSPFYGGGLYGNPYGGGYYDSFYTLGGGSNNAYGGLNGYNSFNPYAAFDSSYGNYNSNGAYGNYPSNYYGNGNNGYYGANAPAGNNQYDANGNYQDNGAGNGAPTDPSAVPNRRYNNYPAAAPAAARVLARTSDTMEAKRVKGDRFYVGWKGENSAVSKITFAMLDLNKRAIMTRTVTQPPGEYTFPITSRMVYYQMVIEYVNGTTSTVTSPL